MAQRNRVIGIPASKSTETFFGTTLNYLEFMNQFGIPRIIMPEEEFVQCDLLLLPGGMDLNPASYGEVPSFKAGHTDVFKQFFFDHRLKNYVNNGTPIFGICLGFQQLAAFFGSKLTQDLKWHAQSAGRWGKAHEVDIHPEVRGVRIYDGQNRKGKKAGKDPAIEVNSHHHQAVLLDNLSEALDPFAFAACEDWNDQIIVEGFIHRELPIAGVQWHPEEWYDTYTYNLITQILLNER